MDRLLGGRAGPPGQHRPALQRQVEPRSNNAIAAGLSSFTAATPPGRRRGATPEKAKPAAKKLRARDRPLANDFVSDEEFDRLLRAWFGNLARVLLPGRGFYVWGGYSNCGNYPPVLKDVRPVLPQAIIWDKQHPVLTRKDYMGAHEWCFYGWREGAAHQFFGPEQRHRPVAIKKVNPQNMVHLTEKPVELAGRAIEYSSRPGENVLDLFGGSGSTLIAAEQAGRRAFLMELDPPYCDVIVPRYEQFTGQKAERAAVAARPGRLGRRGRRQGGLGRRWPAMARKGSGGGRALLLALACGATVEGAARQAGRQRAHRLPPPGRPGLPPPAAGRAGRLGAADRRHA